MPIYSFINHETGDIEEKIMSWNAREEYLKNNPQLKSIITSAPGLITKSGDRTKPPAGFKEVLSKIADANPNSSLANDYGKKDHTSVKIREAVQKVKSKMFEGE